MVVSWPMRGYLKLQLNMINIVLLFYPDPAVWVLAAQCIMILSVVEISCYTFGPHHGIDRVLTGNINCMNLYEAITLSDWKYVFFINALRSLWGKTRGSSSLFGRTNTFSQNIVISSSLTIEGYYRVTHSEHNLSIRQLLWISYNRRLSKYAVQYLGQFIRRLLLSDIHEA